MPDGLQQRVPKAGGGSIGGWIEGGCQFECLFVFETLRGSVCVSLRRTGGKRRVSWGAPTVGFRFGLIVTLIWDLFGVLAVGQEIRWEVSGVVWFFQKDRVSLGWV